jgi:uncharacterized protein YukE
MADLKVDYQLLDMTERNLSSLKSEFDNIKAQTGSYDGFLGSGDIASAMGAFCGNWDYHRGKLVEEMESLGTMVAQTKKSFQDADEQLKASLTGHK